MSLIQLIDNTRLRVLTAFAISGLIGSSLLVLRSREPKMVFAVNEGTVASVSTISIMLRGGTAGLAVRCPRTVHYRVCPPCGPCTATVADPMILGGLDGEATGSVVTTRGGWVALVAEAGAFNCIVNKVDREGSRVHE